MTEMDFVHRVMEEADRENINAVIITDSAMSCRINRDTVSPELLDFWEALRLLGKETRARD